jgi:hypothetical protein
LTEEHITLLTITMQISRCAWRSCSTS